MFQSSDSSNFTGVVAGETSLRKLKIASSCDSPLISSYSNGVVCSKGVVGDGPTNPSRDKTADGLGTPNNIVVELVRRIEHATGRVTTAFKYPFERRTIESQCQR
jgi:hypothetical protein